MPKLICTLLRLHRPTAVVVGFADDQPITAEVCSNCGGRHARHTAAV